MKKYLYIILFALCCTVVSCTETTRIAPGEYRAPAKIELSSTKLIFDADGGCVAVTVAANTEEWDYATEGDWFTVTMTDDNTLQIDAPLNAGAELLTGSVTVSGKKDGEETSASVALTQRTDRSVNLSADGTANCYIAKTGKAYKFDATIKGNGGADGRSTYIQKYGVELHQIAYADLLWEARNDGDKTLSREIIDGAPIYKDGYIAFSTGRSTGNAVIAARSVNGDILWSWHIWVCDDDIAVRDHLNAEDNVVAQIMDRNLGAMNNEPMDVNNRGMFYQWGRKDPFPASRSVYVENASDKPEFNVANDEVGNGTGEWQFYVVAQPLVDIPGNLPYTIQHPMAFLTPYYNDVYEWYCMSSTIDVTDSQLWADEKSIFDPCPPGYKVPGRDMWGVPAGNQKITTGGDLDKYDENGESPEFLWNIFKDGGRTWKYTGDYYPAAGTVSININTTHNNAGIYGFYWTTQTYSVGSRFYRVDFTPHWAEYFSAAPVFSAQIRCVKE